MRLLISGFAETVAWCVAGLLFAAGMGLVAVRLLLLSPQIFWAVIFASFLAVFGFGLIRVIRRGRRRAWGGYTFVGLTGATLAGLIFTFAFKGPTASLKSDDSLGLHFDRMPLPDGSQLAYRQYEPAFNVPSPLPPIIILHGGPGVPPLKSAFDFYGRLTASGRNVYAYEQIGVGQSSKLARIEDYTLQRDVEDLDRFRQAIGAPKVVLVGLSWGTILAAHYMAQHSQAVERVVFISPAAFRQDERFRSDPGPTARADSSAPSPIPLRLFFVEMLAKLAPRAALMLGGQEEIGHDYDLLWADSAFADILSCRGTQPGAPTLETRKWRKLLRPYDDLTVHGAH